MTTNPEEYSHIREAVLPHFQLGEKCIELLELKTGHINKTFVSSWSSPDKKSTRFVHQRINHHVFQNVSGLMTNIQLITKHLKNKLAPTGLQRTLEIIPTTDGASFLETDGEFWRTYIFIEDTEIFQTSPHISYAEEAAATLGAFQRLLGDIDPKQLVDTIPRFHDARFRYEQLNEAISKDAVGKVSGIEQEVNQALMWQSETTLLIDALRGGELPVRVTHNDMKLNNVLFKIGKPQSVALVDLDTCMSGSALFDFGDLVRNVPVVAAEDEVDLSKIKIDTDLVKAMTKGYLREFGSSLTPSEKKLLPKSPFVLATTLGVRFLTDHINGDVYFRAHRDNHNLDRARSQFEVARKLKAVEGILGEAL